MVDYLYHYTDLNTLKLILMSKKFRLSSLANMDDLEEGETEDFEKVGRHIYISSWTSYSEDSLLLWNYSRTNDGIRIRLRPNMFDMKTLNEHVYLHGQSVPLNNVNANPDLLQLMKEDNITFYPPHAELIRVTYTELERLLKPTVYKENASGTSLATIDLGIFKRIEWQEQKEWRYRICSFPVSVLEMIPNGENHGKQIMEKIKRRKNLEYIDLSLKEDAFKDLEVLCSPTMSCEGKKEVHKLLEDYAPYSKVKYSKLKIRPKRD